MELPLCELLLLPLWVLLVLGVVAVVVVDVPLVVLDEPAALAIAAPPPMTAPVIVSIVSRVVILRRIGLTSFLLSGLVGLAGQCRRGVGESSDDGKNQ